jgi:hypothetical protein
MIKLDLDNVELAILISIVWEYTESNIERENLQQETFGLFHKLMNAATEKAGK